MIKIKTKEGSLVMTGKLKDVINYLDEIVNQYGQETKFVDVIKHPGLLKKS